MTENFPNRLRPTSINGLKKDENTTDIITNPMVFFKNNLKV